MWVDELLFVLMAVALIAMAVLALIVGTRKGKGREVTPKEKEVIPVPEPRAKVAREPAKVKVLQVEEGPAAPTQKHIVSPLPDVAHAPPEEPVTIPTPEPIILVESEPPTATVETPEEPTVEPAPEPLPEPASLAPDKDEPKPLEEPHPTELRRETESRFFDLRYENSPRAAIFTEPSILDGSPTIEEEEEEAKEATPGVVTCPHCNSKVPQTLYCIYCGNTLTEKPSASSK